jgi:hypothetical protein
MEAAAVIGVTVEPIGLKQIAEQQWEVRYRFHLLGVLDEQRKTVRPVTHWHKKRPEKL